MAGWDDVADGTFVRERPLRRRDLDERGDAAPSGPVLGARVPDEGAEQALVAGEAWACPAPKRLLSGRGGTRGG